MGGFGFILIIILVVFLLWPQIMRWLQGYMLRKAEDRLRQMAGQPTRKEEEQMRRGRERKQRRKTKVNRHPAQELNKVAEDVQFTEIHEYSGDSIDIEEDTSGGRREYREEQVEDVQYTEIKTDKK